MFLHEQDVLKLRTASVGRPVYGTEKKKKSSNGKPTVKVGEKEEAGLQPQSESESE